jgi:hypothetical protein
MEEAWFIFADTFYSKKLFFTIVHPPLKLVTAGVILGGLFFVT